MQAIEQWVNPSSIPQGLQISFMKFIVLFPGHSSPLIFAQAAEDLSALSHIFSVYSVSGLVFFSDNCFIIYFTIDESKL